MFHDNSGQGSVYAIRERYLLVRGADGSRHYFGRTFGKSGGKTQKLPSDIIIDMCLVIIPCGVVGARLYYVLFHLDRYLQNPISILYIWEGGLAIYGAVIFGLLGAFVFSRVRKVRFLKLADCIMPGLALAQAIGRWGNFFNQEAFGLPVTARMIAQFPALQYFPLAVGIEGTHYFNEAVCTACVTGANGVHLHLATFFMNPSGASSSSSYFGPAARSLSTMAT